MLSQESIVLMLFKGKLHMHELYKTEGHKFIILKPELQISQ